MPKERSLLDELIAERHEAAKEEAEKLLDTSALLAYLRGELEVS